jgi:hypothetical protein
VGRGTHAFYFCAAGCDRKDSRTADASLLVNQTVGAAPLLARRRSQLWPSRGPVCICTSVSRGRPRGAVCMCTPSPDESPLPLRFSEFGCANWQRKGLRDGNLFVGASPVVDYFAFMLENLANSALHRVSGEPLRRCVLRPVDQASNEKQVVERFSCCNT